MTDLYPENIKTLAEAVLNSDGALKPEIRQAVEARVAKHGGATRQADLLPDDSVAYVDKIACHAYKITDEDIERLKASGYSEDEIFEITVSAALGAGLVRVEHSLNMLQGVLPCA